MSVAPISAVRPYGIIYCVTHLASGRRYVGQTRDTAWNRWRSHVRASRSKTNIYFWNAINKYGEEAFRVQQIDSASSREELNRKEDKWIEIHGSLNPVKGFNCKTGGYHAVYSDVSRQRMSRGVRERFAYTGKWPRQDRPGTPEQNRANAFRSTKHFVRCIETDEIFVSAHAAGKLIKLDSNSIYDVMNTSRTCGGYHWIRIEKSSVNWNDVTFSVLRSYYQVKRKRILRVKCIETSQEWPSARQAALSVGMNWTAFMGRIERKEPINGQHFVYQLNSL